MIKYATIRRSLIAGIATVLAVCSVPAGAQERSGIASLDSGPEGIKVRPHDWANLATEPKEPANFREGMVLYMPEGTFHVSGSVAFSMKNPDSDFKVRAVMATIGAHAKSAPSMKDRSKIGVVAYEPRDPEDDGIAFDFGDIRCETTPGKNEMCEVIIEAWTNDSDAKVLPKTANYQSTMAAVAVPGR